MTDFLPPKLWKPGEQYSPIDFNIYIRDNMQAIAERPSRNFLDNMATTDHAYTNTAFAEYTGVEGLVALGLQTPSHVMLQLLTPIRIDTTANRRAYYDVYWEERDIFLSTMTDTPATNGLWTVQTQTINVNISYVNIWMLKDVPEGGHSFQLYSRVVGNTATIDRDQLPVVFNGWAI